MAERIKSEADVSGGRRDAAPAHHVGQLPGDRRRFQPRLQVDRHAGVENYPLKQARQRSIDIKPKAMRTDRAREHQRKPARPILKIVARLAVGRSRIRKLDALSDPPRRPCRAAEYRPRVAISLIERSNGDAVIALRYQPLIEGRAFDRARHERKPLLSARRWKLRECQIVGADRVAAHGTKLTRSDGEANKTLGVRLFTWSAAAASRSRRDRAGQALARS